VFIKNKYIKWEIDKQINGKEMNELNETRYFFLHTSNAVDAE